MALVMLPCDLPWWPTLVRHLKQIEGAADAAEFVDGMLKIHNMCNVGLDPDEPEQPDQTLFEGLQRFLEQGLTDAEREHFLQRTGPSMARRALDMKNLKPAGGLHFSLQQQGDRVEFERPFIASVLAHAFFSMYPKRTAKTHPTLQDCNFSTFFKHLDQKCQRAKLRSIWRYFDEMDSETAPTEKVVISREVMTGKEWLTIEDWLECGLPLCPLAVRHEGRLERAEPSALRVCFANSRLGGAVLDEGFSQEAVQFSTCPELLAVLLCVESLEDNEALMVENLLHVSRIVDPRHRATFEPVNGQVLLTVCCLDAENYRRLPLSQFEEDNVLRELNKALLGFRQHRWTAADESAVHKSRGKDKDRDKDQHDHHQRRLSPIGESFSSNQSDTQRASSPQPAHQPATQTLRARTPRRGRSVSPRPPGPPGHPGPPPTMAGRRARFIVLGSSGECLPISRRKIMTGGLGKRSGSGSGSGSASTHAHAHSDQPVPVPALPQALPQHQDASDSDEFHSAQSSFNESDSDGEGGGEGGRRADRARRYSAELDTPQRRTTFAERLRDALRRETFSSGSSDSSYAVGISVEGPELADKNIRLRRGGSRGFMLDDSVDRQSVESYTARREARLFNQNQARKTGADSSRYSFDTELSSELDDACEQFGRWLDDPTSSDLAAGLDNRDVAVAQFASRLLKRTLSDSFAGVQLTEQQGDVDAAGSRTTALPEEGEGERERRHLKLAHLARSMSLELAKQKHRLASQLISQLGATLARGEASGIRPVATGNWGCGSERAGDPQLKLIIQWLAASVAGAPCLVFYTCGHHKLLKLDTVCRVVLDRHWSVGKLANAALGFAQTCLDSPSPPHSGQALFDEILVLGVER